MKKRRPAPSRRFNINVGKQSNAREWEILAGQSDGESALRPETDWNAVVADEMRLLKSCRIIQRTLRLLGILPLWGEFRSGPVWFGIRDQLDGTAKAKFEAWWEIGLVCVPAESLPNHDGRCMAALAFAIKRVAEGQYASSPAFDAEQNFGVDAETAKQIEEAVSGRIAQLCPR